jgi:hypothetical protein
MNKTISLAAISMFAVIMGLGAFAPALAENNGSNGNKIFLCHFQAEVLAEDGETVLEEESVSAINVNMRSYDAHMAHGDYAIADVSECPVTPDPDEE